ncbi:MAG: right-handed parallel beta-helix repeat-containing protein, partial [Candidatus Latescibacteria bacterium]|nr:right-handed parallel beta-helix repeat-containing protein [Candidatus Latescibacterota bacterium]
VTYPIRLQATAIDSTPRSTHVPYIPLDFPEAQIEVTAVLPGTTFQVVERVLPYAKPLTIPPRPQSIVLTSSNVPSYLSINMQDSVVTIKKGEWEIHTLLVIPDHFRLVIPAGTTLQFGREAGLFVRGPMDCQGTSNAPIIMEGISRENHQRNWMGIVVEHAQTPSLWRYVQIYNTAGIRYNGWSLTGGVTFYRSDITMQNCVFDSHQGEDALNIIHAEFLLDGIRMSNTKSDGFDSDFSNGTIVNCVFENIGYAGGGDAVDFSGSTVKIERTSFKGITDKAVSVGEGSSVLATELQIESAGTGIACKDNSRLEIDHASFRTIQTAAIMAYIKKPEYGPAHVTARNIDLDDDVTPAIVQSGSLVIIDGEEMATIVVDVDTMYETIMKKGI